MFNIGIVTGSSLILIKLSDKELIGYWNGSVTDFIYRLRSDGVASYINSSGAYIPISGEWYTPGRDPSQTIGASYEYKTQLMNGAEPDLGSTYGEWKSLAYQKDIRWRFSGGRVMVSIRKIGSISGGSSAQIWTPGYSP